MADEPLQSLVSLLENVPDPAIVADRDRRIVGMNQPAEHLFGYPRTELVGRPLHELVPGLGGTASAGSAALTRTTTVVARHRDGHPLRLVVSFRGVPLDPHRLTAAYFRPQPEPVRNEPEGTLDRLPVALLRFDRDRRVTFANAPASTVAGRPRAALIGRRPEEFGLPSQAARTLSAVVDEVLRTGEPQRFEIRTGTPGREWWFDATVVPERGADGTARTALLAALDTTRHHQAAQALESSELRFRRLAEGSQDLISQVAPDGRIIYASPAALTLLGVPPRALVGRSLQELVHEEDRNSVSHALERAGATEVLRLVTFRLTRADGGMIHCEMTAHAADAGPDGHTTLICITRDITERVRSEEILRAASRMEATATLAAGVAHDFNNLMTSILGNAELLLTDPSFPDAPSRLSQIADAAKRGGALAQQLLAYARGGKYQTAAVSLNEVVHQTLNLQRHALPPRIQLEEDLDQDLPAIEADPVQVGQVITNLCINAGEAVQGMGRVTVRTRRVELSAGDVVDRPGLGPGPHVLLEVEDTGTGIPAAALPRIFEPFFSTKFQGRGLGLAAAYGIVKNHHGCIEVGSGVDRGTKFSIWLAAVAKPARAVRPPRAHLPTGDETILLVDDDEAVLDVTRALLQRLRYRVLIARNGLEAVEVARGHPGPIHLVILDMGMPLAGGAEAFPMLKEARPEMRVLISSGYELNEVVEGLLQSGADAFLQKPYRVTGLARGIREVLDGQARRDRIED
jgi:PAS domain S-box-containing protein